ncbi:MAG TPA: DUF192 domain-containing protein [Prochlorococcus sp.]
MTCRALCLQWGWGKRLRFPLLWGGLAVGLSVLSSVGVRAEPPPQHLPLEAQWCLKSGTCLLLEVADKAEEQRLGLMQRHALPSGQGMWFPFQPARRLRFWMHNTLAALDMVFVDQGRVIAIEADVPVCPRLPCPSYGPKMQADGVVELAAGEAARLAISVGDAVKIQPLSKPVLQQH